MMSFQFFDITLPNLDTYQVSTQSDLRFAYNWCLKFAPLRHCHVTPDDVMMTKSFGTQLPYINFLWSKFGEDRLFKSVQSGGYKNTCTRYRGVLRCVLTIAKKILDLCLLKTDIWLFRVRFKNALKKFLRYLV